MIKALITKDEIRQFIFDAICEHGRNQVVSRAEIRDILEISDYQLKSYMEKGLPWIGKPTRKRFNVNECRKWMDEFKRKF